MTDSQIQNAITLAFSTGFTATPIEYQNLTLDVSGETEWVRLTIKPYETLRRNLTNGKLKTGVVYVQVFTKLDTANGRATELAELAATVFDLKRIDAIEFDAACVKNIGRSVGPSNTSTDSSWNQVNVEIDYKVVI